LKKKTGCEVLGADKRRIKGIDVVVQDNQILKLGGTEIQVIATPGHTKTSVCYYLPAAGDDAKRILFTGDTLFIGGCGRILECSAKTMWASLVKLAALPDDTLVYCGHDYTLENYEFALTVEPDNVARRQRLQRIRQIVNEGGLTVPSTMSQEKTANIFLRSASEEVKTALGMTGANAAGVFAELRRRKDFF
jgi:hydroxyacylglutathione hydrolase